MLIFQLKRYLSVKFIFHFDSSCNLALISHFYPLTVHITQMFFGFSATTRPLDVWPSKNRILNETLNLPQIAHYYNNLNFSKLCLVWCKLCKKCSGVPGILAGNATSKLLTAINILNWILKKRVYSINLW